MLAQTLPQIVECITKVSKPSPTLCVYESTKRIVAEPNDDCQIISAKFNIQLTDL
jgi:hypothetical protein